jgi:hypothetical protein
MQSPHRTGYGAAAGQGTPQRGALTGRYGEGASHRPYAGLERTGMTVDRSAAASYSRRRGDEAAVSTAFGSGVMPVPPPSD